MTPNVSSRPLISTLRSLFAPLVAAWLALAPTPAMAQEEAAAEATVWSKANDAFAQYVVGTLASAMFFDLTFWDNTLAADKAVNTVQGAHYVTGHDPTRGYTLRERFEATDVVRYVDTPETVVLGRLKAKVRTASKKGVDGRPSWQLVANVPAQDVDLAAIGLEPADETTPKEELVVETSQLAPFQVLVNRVTARTEELDVPLPADAVPIAKGDTVVTPEGRVADVADLGPPMVLLDVTTTTRKEAFPNPNGLNIPVVVAWLVFGACFFTLRMAFVNLRAFPHAIKVTMGAYDDPEEEGEISHFQALSSALSATVVLGNIAGVAVAVGAGGPGAVFWMIVAGFLGMSSKFTECTLGQMYRITRPDGSVSGGPMHYLDKGLEELGLRPLGKLLAVTFAVMCVGGSLGGGNMFQANQSFAAVFDVLTSYGLVQASAQTTASVVYGLVLAGLVGVVIIGGIKRIGRAAEIIVPVMVGIYLLAGIAVLVANAAHVPAAFGTIFSEAFTPQAGLGGMAGVLVQGFRRAAFSNEAGVGSASIAHSAATTQYPVREGIVALLEPFIDTIVVCTMTGVVVVVTGAYKQPGDGVLMTSNAFASVLPWFPIVLSLAVLLFAFSTMISWSYYGERCAIWMFGDVVRTPYRLFFLVCVFFGSVFNLGPVLDFSDLMILGMAFPNILGAILLSGKVKAAFDDYWKRLGRGEFAT